MAPPVQQKAKGFLGKKIGPFSAWVWGAAILALVGAYVIYKRRSGGASSYAGDSGGSVSILGGGQLAPLAASSGAPAENAAPAQSLAPDVLSAISDLQTQVMGLSSDNAFNSGLLQQIDTDIQAQTSSLGAVSTQIATATLAPAIKPQPVTIQIKQQPAARPSNVVAKNKTAKPAKRSVKATPKKPTAKPKR